MRIEARSTLLLLAAVTAACHSSHEERAAHDGSTPPPQLDASADASDTDAEVVPAEERCFAADSEAACGAVKLEQLPCDDCWHQCLWLQTHEVARAGDSCEYGAAHGACVYQRGGEGDDGTTLAHACLGTGYSSATFWIDRSNDPPRVAFLPAGHLTYPGFELCGQTDAPFARSPECECPCLPGYPDAECIAFAQEREPDIASGIELCPGVPHHRLSAPECVDDIAMFACSVDRGTCRSDADCAGGERCLENDNFCTCTASCATEADCNDGEACVCRHHVGPSVCATATCKTDADCLDGDVCAVSYGKTNSSGGCEPKALACRTPFIECEGVRCGPNEMCTYDAATEHWICASNDRCEAY